MVQGRPAGIIRWSMSPFAVLVLLLAIRMASNCWPPALNVAHTLLHVVGKVHGCFILVKKYYSKWICARLLHTCKRSQASTAGHPGVHNLMPEAQNEG